MTSVRGQAVMRKKKCWRKSGGDDTASDCVFGCEKNGSGEVAKRRGEKNIYPKTMENVESRHKSGQHPPS